jgi:hypothetical protein
MWKSYTDQLYRGLDRLASWPPSNRAHVGDVASFEGRSLELRTTLAELGVEAGALAGKEVRDLGWASTGTVVVNPSLAGAAPLDPAAAGEAELSVEFKAEHAIMMRAEQAREDSLDRLERVRRELLRLHEDGIWQREWVLVTHAVRAERLIALISSDREASAQLRLSGGMATEAGALARVAGKVTVTQTTGMAFEELGVLDATPLYQAVRVQERPLRGDRVKRVGKRGRARPEESRFEIVEVTF